MTAAPTVRTPCSDHMYPTGASMSKVASLVTAAFSGVASIAAFALAVTEISPSMVPLLRVRLNPSLASLPDAEISMSPSMTDVPVTSTATDG